MAMASLLRCTVEALSLCLCFLVVPLVRILDHTMWPICWKLVRPSYAIVVNQCHPDRIGHRWWRKAPFGSCFDIHARIHHICSFFITSRQVPQLPVYTSPLFQPLDGVHSEILTSSLSHKWLNGVMTVLEWRKENNFSALYCTTFTFCIILIMADVHGTLSF
jgi:hypothetical protein